MYASMMLQIEEEQEQQEKQSKKRGKKNLLQGKSLEQLADEMNKRN